MNFVNRIVAQEDLRNASGIATSDIVTSGKTEKLQAIEKMRNNLNDTIDDSCDYLRKLANLESKISAEIGIFYVTSSCK